MLDALLADFRMTMAVPLETAMARLTMAMLLGASLGYERELHATTAGFRTHILVALAACLFTIIGFELMEMDGIDEHIRTDPLRLIGAVTAGVAFLAAGSIIVSGGKVQGLTTGAGMWMAGAIGLACGAGRLWLAILAAALALAILWLLGAVAERIISRRKARGPAASLPDEDGNGQAGAGLPPPE